MQYSDKTLATYNIETLTQIKTETTEIFGTVDAKMWRCNQHTASRTI